MSNLIKIGSDNKLLVSSQDVVEEVKKEITPKVFVSSDADNGLQVGTDDKLFVAHNKSITVEDLTTGEYNNALLASVGKLAVNSGILGYGLNGSSGWVCAGLYLGSQSNFIHIPHNLTDVPVSYTWSILGDFGAVLPSTLPLAVLNFKPRDGTSNATFDLYWRGSNLSKQAVLILYISTTTGTYPNTFAKA